MPWCATRSTPGFVSYGPRRFTGGSRKRSKVGWPRDPAVAADLAQALGGSDRHRSDRDGGRGDLGRAGRRRRAWHRRPPTRRSPGTNRRRLCGADASAGHVDALIRLGHGAAAPGSCRRRRCPLPAKRMELAVALGESSLQARAAIGLGRRYPYWETDAGRIEALEGALSPSRPSIECSASCLMGLLGDPHDHRLRTGTRPPSRRSGRRDRRRSRTDPTTEPEVLLAVGQTRVYDCIEDPSSSQR